MPKMRIHEIAKQWNIDSKMLIKGLKDIGVSVSSHQSIISEEDVLRLRASIDGQSPSSSDSAGGVVRKSTLIRRAGDGGSDVKVIRRRRGGSQDSTDELETSHGEAVQPAEAELPKLDTVTQQPTDFPGPATIKENESVSVAEANETSAKTAEIPEMSGDFKAALSLDTHTSSPQSRHRDLDLEFKRRAQRF